MTKEILIYNYSPVTGEFIGFQPAEISPLDKVPVLMAYSTFKAPPVVNTNERAIFLDVNDDVPSLESNGQWTIVPDFRGQTYWDEDGNEHIMVDLGFDIPKDCSLTKPEESLESLKTKKLAEIKDARNAHEFGTFFWNGHEFDCNQVSQQRFVIATLGAQTNPSLNFDWRLANNDLITLSSADLISVVTAMGQNTEDAFNHFNALEALINIAPTKEDLENITW